MAALNNTVTTAEMNVSLDREFIRNYRGEYDRLAELVGLFSPEVVSAGTALYQTSITGTLNDTKTDSASSGTAYVEGDEVALSKYQSTKVPVDVTKVVPYRRMTTADAILKSGYDVAVLRTDAKMLSQVRGSVVSKLFGFLATGTGTATGTNLQAALANVDGKLGDTMETNGDSPSAGIVHLVNRMDAATYLGAAPVTTQTVFGLTYLESFLGIQSVLLTNQVASGTVIATPTDNVHPFTLDFAELGRAGLTYAQEDRGLVAVAHTPAYDRVSAETHVVNGLTLFAEVTDYIVKGTIVPAA